MSGNDDTEQKRLPPTQRKLKKAREKGQVAKSNDFVTASVVITGLLFVIFSWTKFAGLFSDSLALSTTNLSTVLSETILAAFHAVVVSTIFLLTPFLIIKFIVVIITNILHKKGIPFSLHPVKPDFNKINPAKGLKRVFSVRNFTEFSLSLIRLLLWITVAALLLWLSLPALLDSPLCGLPCATNSAVATGQRFVVAAIIALVIIAVADLPVQFALFRREQRMGVREKKQELRDTQGSPEIRSRRRQLHREMAMTGARLGVKNATFVLEGSGYAIALQFDSKASEPPVVVAKGEGVHAQSIIANVNKLGLPCVTEPELVKSMYRTVGVGEMIQSQHIRPIVLILTQLGLL